MNWAVTNFVTPRTLCGRCISGKLGTLDAELITKKESVTKIKSLQIIGKMYKC
jgi:hypothetical protein